MDDTGRAIMRRLVMGRDQDLKGSGKLLFMEKASLPNNLSERITRGIVWLFLQTVLNSSFFTANV